MILKEKKRQINLLKLFDSYILFLTLFVFIEDLFYSGTKILKA